MEDNKTINVNKDAKLIFNMGVGRALLKAGCVVIDVKPDRANPDKTVLVFKNDETFQRELARINKEIAEVKAAKKKEAQ